MGTTSRELAGLFDDATGGLVGYIDGAGQEQSLLTAAQMAALSAYLSFSGQIPTQLFGAQFTSGVSYSNLSAATFGGSGGSGALDSAFGAYGNKPAILTVNAGNTGNYATLTDATVASSSFMDDGEQMYAVLEIGSGMNDGNAVSFIFSPDAGATKTATVSVKLDTRKTLHFLRFYCGTNDFAFSGGMTFSDTVNWMQIKVDSAGGTNGGTLKVHGVWRGQRMRSQVVIGFDDGFLSQYRHAINYMTRRGLLGYVAASVDYVGGNYMSAAQMNEIYRCGWDITVHGSKNHNDGTLTTRDLLKAEIKRNLDYTLGNGWSRGSNCYVYPGGIINSALDSRGVLAELGFSLARAVTYGGGGTNDQTCPTPFGLDDKLCLHARELSGSFSASSDLSLLDRAIDNGSSVWYYGHEIVRASPGANQMTWSEFTTFIDGVADRRRDGKCAVVTPTQFSSTFGI